MVQRSADRGLLVGRILQLDHAERQPVDEDHDVRPPVVPLRPDHRELVDRQPVVVVRIVEVNHARLRARDRPVRPPVLDRDAIDEHPMDGPVAVDESRPLRPNDLAEGVVEGVLRQVRVQSDEGLVEAPLKDHVAVGGVAALGGGLAEGDFGAVSHGEARTGQPGQSCFFYIRLGDSPCTHRSPGGGCPAGLATISRAPDEPATVPRHVASWT